MCVKLTIRKKCHVRVIWKFNQKLFRASGYIMKFDVQYHNQVLKMALAGQLLNLD